jgi:CheY-like chemotaxis protein
MVDSEFGRAVNILLVEDSESDVAIAREGFKEARAPNNLYVVRDGVEALQFLRRQNRCAEAPRPDLILLELDLPRKDGRTVLAEIKSDPALTAIPVVVLTKSMDEKDIERSYASHANCYVAKPSDLARFRRVIKTIQDFWLTVVRLPGAV